jgi:hypothetical protein
MGILGDYLPNWLPDDPNQNTAARQGLLSAGAALMGGRGNLGGILAGGLMAGQQGYNGALQQQQQAGLMAAQTQSLDLGNQQARAAIDRPMRLAAIAAGNYPGLQSSDPAAPPSVDAGPRIQPLSALPQLGAPSVVQATGSTNPTSEYALNMDLSKRYALAGEYELAKQYNDMAIKSRPEVQEVKTALDASGKPVQVITFKDGSQRTSDYGALPDNQIVDLGGSQALIDKNTGKQGATFGKSVTPGEQLQSNDQAKARAQSERHWQAEQAAAPDDAPMDPLAVRMTAQQYLAGDSGALQNFGRGRQGAANLNAVRLEVAKQANAAGLNGADIAAKMAEFQGLKAGQRTAGIRSASIEIAANEVAQLAPIALEASSKVSRSGYLPFGKAGIMFDSNTNNPAMRQFAMANTALVNAYGQAMARGGAATVSDKDHARELLSTAFDQPSYAAAVAQLQRETRAAQAAPKQVRQDLSDAVSGREVHPASAAVTPLSNLPKKAPAAIAQPYSDAEKERRYQEWKRSQNK